VPLSIGTASTDITPPPGLDIAGSLWATQSTGTRDPLSCRALVLDDGTTRAVLIAIDVIMLERPQVLRARELIAARTGIPGCNVMIACSHTHAGPATGHYAATRWPEAYMEALPRRIADAVVAALSQTMLSVAWGYTQGEERTLGHYRRIQLRNGRVRNSWLLTPDADVVGPAGDIDPAVPIIAFRAASGVQAIVANFACHATCSGDGRWSANYPGYFMAGVARRLGIPDSGVLYTAGAAANTNPVVTDPVEFGERLADVVPPLLANITWKESARLTVREQWLSLPARHMHAFPFADIAEAYAPRFSQLNFGKVVKYYADEYVKLIERGPVPVETALQVIALDVVALIAVGGELFVELGREIQRRSPFAKTVVVTLANDWIGYIPHRAAFDEGGYETIFGSQSRLAPEAGEMVVDAAVALLSDAAGTVR